MLAYLRYFNVSNFKDTLTNNIISFEQPDPEGNPLTIFLFLHKTLSSYFFSELHCQGGFSKPLEKGFMNRNCRRISSGNHYIYSLQTFALFD